MTDFICFPISPLVSSLCMHFISIAKDLVLFCKLLVSASIRDTKILLYTVLAIFPSSLLFLADKMYLIKNYFATEKCFSYLVNSYFLPIS